MMRAVRYLRWSSEKQSKGSSFDRQRAKIDDFCLRMGWDTSEPPVVDEGASGWSGENMFSGELSKLRERFARDGGHGYVLVAEQLDRLSRLDTLAVIEFYIAMTRSGLTIATADNRMIVTNDTLRLQTEQLKEIVEDSDRARRESNRKSDLSRGAWEAMRRHGVKVHTSGTCPAWLHINKDRTEFTINPARVVVLNEIFEAYASGLSMMTIVRRLNERAEPTWRGGKGWQGSVIKALIHNRAVIGEYQHQRRSTGELIGDPDPAYFPAVISNELFQSAAAVNATKYREGRGRSVFVRNVLAAISSCDHCGSRLYFNLKNRKGGKVDAYLQCSSYFRGFGCDASTMHKYQPIQDAILDQLLSLALDDQHFRRDDEISALSSQLADQKRIAEDVGRRLDNITNEIESSPSDRLRARRRELEAAEDAAKGDVVETERLLVVARGAVAPQEHIRRVAEIRADMMNEDDDVGVKARTVVKKALDGLLSSLTIRSDGQVVAQVREGLRSIVILKSGEVWNFDLKHPSRPVESDDPAVTAYVRRLEAAKS